jgi:hypothetical protein
MDLSNRFVPEALPVLPEPVTRYFAHALTPGAPLSRRIRLRMHGRIRVGRWLPFRAWQVIDAEQGFRWEATVAGGLIRGYDSLDDGRGITHFTLLGGIPLADAAGPDITRSALGRALAEQAAWLPAALLPRPGVHWGAPDRDHAVVRVDTLDGSTLVALTLGDTGQIREIGLNRWGNPDGGGFAELPFGMRAEAEATFGGVTIPARGRVGWWYGTDRWAEFFRFIIDDLSTG